MHGITDRDVKGAPTPREAVEKLRAFAGDAILVGHNVGFDLGFLEAALGDGTRYEPGTYLDTLVLAREAYPEWAESYKLGDLARFFGVELSDAHRALPDAEATAQLLGIFAEDLPNRIATLREGIAASVRANRTGGDPAGLLEAARRQARVSKGLFGLVHKKTVRELVLAEGIRMDGRAVDELRPISVEVGLLPRTHGSGLFTRGETQALTVATLGPSSDVQRIDTISPEDREALPPPLQHAALLHRREQADARPRPARDRPRQPRRAGADPGPPEPGGVPVRHPSRQRVRHLERLDLDGLDLRLDARPHGRRGADLGAGRRRGDGPHHRARRPLRRPDRHPRQGGCVR